MPAMATPAARPTVRAQWKALMTKRKRPTTDVAFAAWEKTSRELDAWIAGRVATPADIKRECARRDHPRLRRAAAEIDAWINGQSPSGSPWPSRKSVERAFPSCGTHEGVGAALAGTRLSKAKDSARRGSAAGAPVVRHDFALGGGLFGGTGDPLGDDDEFDAGLAKALCVDSPCLARLRAQFKRGGVVGIPLKASYTGPD